MVQFTDSILIAKQWEELKKNNPNLTCPHVEIQKEYAGGTDTQDYICMSCGEIFTRKEMKQIREQHSKKEE